ncbi:hypothetical protein D3C76_1515300 [compost metagenome]
MVMAVEMRRFTAKEVDETVKLAVKFTRNLVERQRALLCHLPDPFPQQPVTRQSRHRGKRHAKRQHEVHPHAELRQIATQRRRMFHRLAVDQRSGGCHDAVTTGFGNTVVLTF